QSAAGFGLPKKGSIFVSATDEDKPLILKAVKKLSELGFAILATTNTYKYLSEQGLKINHINKIFEGHPHIEDAMRNYQINLVFNTSNDDSAIDDAVLVRRTAMLQKIPYYTTVAAINATSIAIEA